MANEINSNNPNNAQIGGVLSLESDNSTTAPAKNNTAVKGVTNLLDALYLKGFIDGEKLKSIRFESLNSGKTFEEILLAGNVVSEENIQRTKAEMYGFGYIDLSSISIDSQLINRLPKDAADRNDAIVFFESPQAVKVAMADPLDLQKVKFIESTLGKRVDPYYATRSEVRHVIDTRYGAQVGKDVDLALEDVTSEGIGSYTNKLNVEDLSASAENAPVTRIVNMILDYAVNHKASDVHIEPRENKIAVRFRVHGILSEKLSLPPQLAAPIVTRIKILANMKIDEHRVPQDNRFQVKLNNEAIDIRVSVMPSLYGEKIVLRLLEKGGSTISLEETGLRGPGYKIYRDALAKTQGIILITGPTGSGKTVTLASSLGILNRQEVNIVTVEDPVEVRIDGITQVQVNPDVGLTFATALRSFLRQDPDVIMVGEIRDGETASLAVQAALVGRLVLATLHTNSAAGALPRLLDMGIQPFLLASTINVVVAQRLVRRLCDECKQEIKADEQVVGMMHKALDDLGGIHIKSDGTVIDFAKDTQDVKIYKAVGCPKCGETGYSGRLGIFEVMPMNDKIGKLILSSSTTAAINEEAIKGGMITMVQDGYLKVLEGQTTIEEVLRVQNV